MAFRDDWERGLQPEAEDGRVLREIKALLREALPVEPLAEVIDLPTRDTQRLLEHGDGTLKVGDSVLRSSGGRSSDSAPRRSVSRRCFQAIKYLLNPLLSAHGRSLSRPFARVKPPPPATTRHQNHGLGRGA